MDILLLGISHKTAPAQVRGLFAYTEEQQLHILKQLMADDAICEAVILSTCNRTEVYCSALSEREAFRRMEQVLLEESGAEEPEQVREHFLRFCGERAVHHLFKVTAGLDSVVLGEDQILGQVKQAYLQAQEQECCQAVFHTMFRLAITSAKKIKTDTVLSKTSVSTAGLALRKAQECLGTLKGKKLLLIGASGQIGNIVLKDALDIKGLSVYAAVRRHMPCGLHNKKGTCETIPYEARYEYMNEMDVIISATTSPHYTVTRERFEKVCGTDRQRVLFDLAVPFDIEEKIGELEGVSCYNMEDMEAIAKKNNERKMECVAQAKDILADYEERFYKWFVFEGDRKLIERSRAHLLEDAEQHGMDKALSHFFYGIREAADVEELQSFLRILHRLED